MEVNETDFAMEEHKQRLTVACMRLNHKLTALQRNTAMHTMHLTTPDTPYTAVDRLRSIYSEIADIIDDVDSMQSEFGTHWDEQHSRITLVFGDNAFDL